MLSGLRLRLTALYLGVGLAFLLLVGIGCYSLLRGYYQTITDLALQHRLVQELGTRGAAVPPAVAAADQRWYASRGRGGPHPTPQPAAVTRTGDDGTKGEGGDDHGSEEEREHGAPAGPSPAPSQSSGAVGGPAPNPDADDSAAEEAYDGELAAIFLQPLRADGTALTSPSRPVPVALASTDAVTRALSVGIDWRTVSAPDGSQVRLLTYALPDASGPIVLQLGRPLADQERVLHQLLSVLLGLGALSAVLLGAGGWWLAGRSLRPAEEAWQRQQTFVANASHELRTPLTLIRASAEVLSRNLPAAGTHRPLIADILAESDHMSRLVSDLLLLSRLDSGQLDVQPAPVALDALCADLARQFGRLAEERGVTFVVDAAPGELVTDATRLRQVLLVLLDNALRHTPSGGTIRLTARPEGARWTLVVADTGTGIAPEDLPRVFERFYRVEPSSAEPGAGLGLAVAHGLVEALGGQIRLDSAPASGTRVTITLPSG